MDEDGLAWNHGRNGDVTTGIETGTTNKESSIFNDKNIIFWVSSPFFFF